MRATTPALSARRADAPTARAPGRGLALVRGDEVVVGCGELLGGDHCCCALPEKFGAVGPELRSELDEPFDEVVVELDEDPTSSQLHMASPMLAAALHADRRDSTPMAGRTSSTPATNGPQRTGNRANLMQRPAGLSLCPAASGMERKRVVRQSTDDARSGPRAAPTRQVSCP